VTVRVRGARGGAKLMITNPVSGANLEYQTYWMASGGAWIHVGADAAVTAFTGKVDFGQDNRTALALLVAEELRTAFSIPQCSASRMGDQVDIGMGRSAAIRRWWQAYTP